MYNRSSLSFTSSYYHNWFSILQHDILTSTNLIFQSKLTWLLIFGPIALVGKTGVFGEPICFILAGLTLIPLAERLSFVTEEVASHTNQTIGALLNATFGNAPELLISSAALKEGYYRVVQLTLLGSMLTNLLFVFGLSCLIGGFRYQVQELRIVSGNASIGMLMLAVAGLALPAALMLSDEMIAGEYEKEYIDKNGDGKSDINDGPTFSMVLFSRFNAVFMIMGYLLYLLFQLGSHKDEYLDDLDEEEEATEELLEEGGVPRGKRKKKAKKNKFCHRLFRGYTGADENNNIHANDYRGHYQQITRLASIQEMEMSPRSQDEVNNNLTGSQSLPDYISNKSGNNEGEREDLPQSRSDLGATTSSSSIHHNDETETTIQRRVSSLSKRSGEDVATELVLPEQSATSNGRSSRPNSSNKSHSSDGSEEEPYNIISTDITPREDEEEIHMSFRAGLIWLSIITLSVSAMSDILVDTIDGFAYRMHISEVFTSLVILPYFSNIAEQVSALIFAYKDEMDLVVGITVGSAVQIALFVLPGSVLIGWAMDRSMSLFFRGFETCCLIFSVVSIAAVIQGGTTNWLVGAYLLGVYFIIAAGFWFHELENLSIDGELLNLHNHTA